MAVFTAIAAVITGAISGAGFAAAFAAAGTLTGLGIATSLVAAGLGIATARALAPSMGGALQQQKDPGVKVQLAPSTDNRIPVFYGKITTGAIAVDAEIKNQNNTMVYVMVIGEETDSGSYTVSKIYRGDAVLNFGSAGSSHIVQSITDPNATSSTDVAGKIRCRVYAGGTAAGNQVFPTTGIAQPATTLISTIDGTTNYDGLVYAVMEIDYDPENGLTGLGQISFEIENSLKEPSNVLLDYLQNSRYGAGLSSGDLDLTSFNDMYDYSTAQVDYITTGNVTTTHDRWQIDGMISTYNPVKDNIDSICAQSSTFFTYDPKGGKFRVVPNRAATTAEKSAAFVFDNDNILSSITISSTELYSLYNSIEAEFPQVNQKDQTSAVVVSTPTADRNPNEPDNPLNTRFNLVNDAPRAHNLANIDLRQSRISKVIEFEADYSAIQVDVGDVVKVTEPTYGFSAKLFRVMRVTELESVEGMLSVKVSALEYNDTVYDHNVIQSLSGAGVSGIPGYYIDWGNATIDLGNVIFVGDGDGNADVIDPDDGSLLDSLPPDLLPIALGPFGPITGPWMGFNFQIPPGLYYDQLQLEVTPQNAGTTGNVHPTVYTFTPPIGTGTFSANNAPLISIPMTGYGNNALTFANVESITASIRGKDSITGVASKSNTTANINVVPKDFVPLQNMATFTSGALIEDDPPNNTSVVSGTTFNNVITPAIYDIEGSDIGDYSFTAVGNLGGTIGGTPFDVGWTANTTVQFANATANINVTTPMGGVELINAQDFTPQLVATGIFTTDATAIGGVANDMTARLVQVEVKGYTTVGTSVPAPRGFGNMKYEIVHITKGKK